MKQYGLYALNNIMNNTCMIMNFYNVLTRTIGKCAIINIYKYKRVSVYYSIKIKCT